jgi:hypothetical protein
MKQTLAQWLSVSLVAGSLFFSVPTVQASTFDLNTPSSWALNWATFQNMLAHPLNQNHSLALMRMGLRENLNRIGDISNFPVQFDWMADLIPSLDLLLSIPTRTEGGAEQLQLGLETNPIPARSLFPLDGLQSLWMTAQTGHQARSTTGLDIATAMERLDQSLWQLQLRKKIGRPLGLMSELAEYAISVHEPLTEYRQSVGQ